MKIEMEDNKIIVYLFRYVLDLHNMEKLNKEIKNIFIKLIKIYDLDFFGYSKVDIYVNKKYGCILEIDKIYNNDFNKDIIDLKLVIHENIPFYLEISDYIVEELYNKIFIKNNKFYIDLVDIDNLAKYIEFGNIRYKGV